MAKEKSKGICNIHAHHLIGDYIPDEIFKQQVEKYCKLLRSEWFVKYILGFPLFHLPIALFVGIQPIKALSVLRAKNISKARNVHLKEMKNAGIDYSIVLLLDYAFAAKPKPGEQLKPYDRQLEEIAGACHQKPFRFFLFHCFEPRRENAIELLKHAFNTFGIVGIKMYPALGFHPVPEKNIEFHCANKSLLNPNQSPGQRIEMLRNNLRAMYEFASENNLPILTHCGPGGSFLTLIDEKDKGKLQEYTAPGNFLEIAKKYNLRVCLAHMGGKIHLEEKAKEWRKTILKNIKIAHNWTDSNGRIYTDLSYDLSRVVKDKEKLAIYINDTKEYLDDEIVGKYVLFGSDWPMGLFSFSEKDYIRLYREGLTGMQREKFFQENCARFLFGETKQVPECYIESIVTRLQGKAFKTPSWVREGDGKYFLV
jgi:predicted TIM-barrel fold metal-dependent hydrolase